MPPSPREKCSASAETGSSRCDQRYASCSAVHWPVPLGLVAVGFLDEAANLGSTRAALFIILWQLVHLSRRIRAPQHAETELVVPESGRLGCEAAAFEPPAVAWLAASVNRLAKYASMDDCLDGEAID